MIPSRKLWKGRCLVKWTLILVLFLLLFILVGTIGMGSIFYPIEKRLIYYPERGFVCTPDFVGIDYEDVWIQTDDGVRIHGWLTKHESPIATLLFFHGNAGNISHRVDNLRLLHSAGIRTLIIDYRGFGRSEGEISEQGLYLDALAAYSALCARPDVPEGSVAVFGRSLGGAVAVDLATKVSPSALILESTFTSVRDMVAHIFPILPIGSLLSTKYESLDKIGHIRSPVLFVHGTRDELVPYALGKKLFDAASEPKAFHRVDGGGHNDTYIVGGTAYIERLRSFLEETVRRGDRREMD